MGLVRKENSLTMKIMLEPEAIMPTRAHPTDAGLDLYSREEKVIMPRPMRDAVTGQVKTVPIGEVFDTGVHIQFEKGLYGTVTGRSGLNIKHNIICPCGTIDQGFTGSIRVKLYNLGTEPYVVHKGDRIAQLIIKRCEYPEFEQVDSLEETERNESGIGSTGK